MRRRKPNYKKIGGFFLFLCLAVGFSVYWFAFRDTKEPSNVKNPVVDDEKEEDKPKESSLDMVMVGDVLVHGNVYNDAKTGSTYDFSPMFDDVRDFMKNYDLAFYNQETPFGGKALGYSGYPAFNTPSEVGDAMLDMGFNLVSLATNHTMDKGATGAINALGYWNSKSDVLAAGSYLSEEDRDKTVIKEKNGIKYTMLAYTVSSNMAIPSSKSYLLNMYDKEKVKADIERVRDKVDLLMVSMHWGTEYQLEPNAQQKEIAAYLASLGVDIIIGTHTHSVEPIEYIDGTLVFYSLGNFISSQLYDDNLVGLMPTLKITKKEANGKSTINISDLDARLIYTSYKGGRTMNSVHTDHKVIPFDQLTADIFPQYKTYYEKYKEVITSMDSSIPVAALSE
jgi:poly-gamma-glutamate synthesis protein (capsule biosynthesis protein)